MPVLRVSVGVPFAPQAHHVQRFFDDCLELHFSPRCTVDTKWASHNAYVFFAAEPGAQTTVWLSLIGNELDAFELQNSRHSFRDIPVPVGRTFQPVESTGTLGILALRPANDTSPICSQSFLMHMQRPPYTLPAKPVLVPAEDIPVFELPGTPRDPPPISSDSSSSSVSGSADFCSVSSGQAEEASDGAVECAPSISSSSVSSSPDNNYISQGLTHKDVSGESSDEDVGLQTDQGDGASLLQTTACRVSSSQLRLQALPTPCRNRRMPQLPGQTAAAVQNRK